MDKRSEKSRSLGTESKTSKQPNASRHQQIPKQSNSNDRHKSAPPVTSRQQSDGKHLLGDSNLLGTTTRDHQVRTRDEALSQRSRNNSVSQLSERIRHGSQSASIVTQVIDHEGVPVIRFAVVGTAQVGKSTFIQNALNVSDLSTWAISSMKIRVGGLLYHLQLVETPRSSIKLNEDDVAWPYTSESGVRPQVDGVFYLYDVSDEDSLKGLPSLLTALSQDDVPICLVACKIDIPEDEYDIPITFSARVQQRFPSILLGQSSSHLPDSAQQCLLKIVERSLGVSAGRSPEYPKSDSHTLATPQFPTRHSSINPSNNTASSYSSHSQRNLGHPTNNFQYPNGSFPTQTLTALESEDESEGAETSLNNIESTTQSASKIPLRLITRDLQGSVPYDSLYTPLSINGPSVAQTNSTFKKSEAAGPSTPDSLGDRMDQHERSHRTFLDMDDESLSGTPIDDVGNRMRKMSLEDGTPPEGVSFMDLVNRLLATPTSKGDSKFIPSFLCLYRVFATPRRLLMAIIDAFVKTDRSNLTPLTKTAELLRCLGVLGQWTMYYPGDFANPTVWEMAATFVTTVEKTKAYAAAAKQIANNLQTSIPDDDSVWTFSDTSQTGRSRANTTPHRGQIGPHPSIENKYARRHRIRYRDEDDSDSNDDIATPSSARHSATTSSTSSFARGSYVSSQTSDLLHNLEIARERAQNLRLMPHNQLSKVQWHQFMSYPTDELAMEITRIDWTVYSAIRLREFVRYAMVPNSQRAQIGQVDYIGIMTKHFNHLALFVAGMILLRDKPKHRAKMLEKFMDLAWKVRQLNNYHALGAIVAALNGEEIVRLSQTQELISHEQHKQFLRLKILMGHQKSHAAYRMAWENSPGERIPFLPRVQEDLIKAATANPTFVGGLIKWSKFEVMGETLISIQKSQEQPYVFPDKTSRSQDIERLILETKVLESNENSADPQQELYERSKQVEPTPLGGERKKFDWLRR